MSPQLRPLVARPRRLGGLRARFAVRAVGWAAAAMLAVALGGRFTVAEAAPASAAPSTAGAEATAPPSAAPDAEPAAAPEGAPGASSADTLPPPDPKAQAQALMSEGNALVAEADFAAALEKYQAAYAVYPSAKLLINIGTSLRYLGRNADAARSYERYLAHPDAAQERKKELRRIIEEISLTTGLLHIEVEPPDAVVRVDGDVLPGRSRVRTYRADPGNHTVVGQRPGFVPAVRTVALARGAEVNVPLQLARPGTPSPAVVAVEGPSDARTAGYVVGAVGLGGLVLGGVFGGLSLSNDAAAADHCAAANPRVCDSEGVDLGGVAKEQGIVSVVGLAAGGALTALGLVLVLATPDEPTEQPKPTAVLRVGSRLEAVVRF